MVAEVKNTEIISNGDLKLSLPKLSDAHSYRGLVIGDQKDSAEIHAIRKIAQSAYKNLLADDIEKKSITRICSVHRKSMCQIAVHEDNPGSGLNLGKDVDVEKQERRNLAKVLQAQALIDLEGRLEATSRQKLLLKKSEVAGSFSIGGKDIDRVIKRTGKKYQALPSTTNSPPNESSTARSGILSLPVEVEVIAVTGLQIGGHSSDESKQMLSQLAKQRLAKQRIYCLALQDQQIFDAKCRQDKLDREKHTYTQLPSLPYMRY